MIEGTAMRTKDRNEHKEDGRNDTHFRDMKLVAV
jgi:hypothetical protein